VPTKHGDHEHGHGGHEHGHGHGGHEHGHDHGAKHKKHKHDHSHKDGQAEGSSTDLKGSSSLLNSPIVALDSSSDCDEDDGFIKHENTDVNFKAVFLHYLGDALSSVFVLAAGLLAHYFPGATWAKYLDPVASLLIVILVLWTTIPLVKSCAQVLLQQVPPQIQIPKLTDKLREVPGIQNVHDVHVWQLVDNMTIASLHIVMEEGTTSFQDTIARAKKVLHSFGIHSSTLQPEFGVKTSKSNNSGQNCEQNCIKDCKEDWCCKEEQKVVEFDYDTFA